jgi:MYXO-CTERM domain-containing protein
MRERPARSRAIARLARPRESARAIHAPFRAIALGTVSAPRTRMLTRVLFVCSAFALVVGCSSNDTAGVPSEPVASSSSAITTTDVLSRAEQWVNAKLLYCQSPNHAHDYDTACSSTCTREDNADWDPYRSDCSGFVSWSWGLPAPGRVTGQFAPADTTVSHAIQGTDLQPGDALNYPADHIILFVKWITQNTEAQFYEEPGCSANPPYAHSFTSNVTINGESVHVDYEGMTFTAIRYNDIQPPNAAPTGYLDSASCTDITGWSQDPDAKTTALSVTLTFDAPTGKAGSGTIKAEANIDRADLCTPLGSCNHGYDVATPVGLRDGMQHSVYAYGEDAEDSSLQLLTNAPMNFTCAPPAIPAGVKRHVINPASMTAWQFDPVLDVAHEPAAAVNAVPSGADLPVSPTVVIADDGSPSVWVIDGAARRHVIDPASMTAWQFAATTWPAAKIDAIAQGLDWPAAPFVMEGTNDPAVYVMDETADSATGDGGAPSGSDGGTSGDTPSSSSGGCNVSGASNGVSGAWLAIAFALLAVRRRK